MSSNILPQSFVDTLTPEQAEAIMNMHEKTKGWIWDSNDLKYFFSDSQIKMLENKARAVKGGDITLKMAEARNLIRKWVTPGAKYTETDQQNLISYLKSFSTKELEDTANEFTRIINEEEAKWFGNKKLKDDLKKFITSDFRPALRPNEWAFEYTDPKTDKPSIKIINMKNAIIDEKGKKYLNPELITNEGLSLQDAQKEYGKWFVAKNIDLTESLESEINGYSNDIQQSIEAASKELPTKINDALKKGTITIGILTQVISHM